METEEPILSPELMEALGNDPQALILSKKKKDKEKKPQIAQEIVENVKKVSKKSAKRMAQIQKRKVRESKQSEYLELIKSNELSSEQRQLMTSSKTLNHTMSLKETLSLLIKKEKAGIPLTDEERSLLYTQKESLSVENEDIEDLFGKYMRDPKTEEPIEETENISFKKKKNNSKDPESETLTNNKEVIEEKADELLFSLSDMMPTFNSTSSSIQNMNGNNDKKKKKKKKNQSINENEAISDEMEVQEQEIHPEPPNEIPIEKSKRKLSEDIPVPETQKSKDLEHEQSPPIKKKSKKSEGVSTIGKSMLSQFLKFKAKVDSQEKPTLSALMNEIETSIPEGNDIELLTKEDSDIPHNPFIAEEMNLPFNSLGYVQLSEEEKQKASLIQQQIVKRKVFMINRPREVEMDRINLPVCQMEQEIVEAINSNDVILLCGETGSGKSTQVPQFLYEVGYSERGMIGIAQPRRVAVTSTADRVNYEMGQSDRSKDGRLVGYQIRYDSSTVGPKTKLKYMTDGILLREVTSDILLRQYSVVILDEAHERNVNTDLLLGMISRTLIVRKRIAKQEQALWAKLSPEEQAGYQPPLHPLKLVIMSATIRVKDFQAEHLFPQIPPVIHVQARQYPVTTHFAKKTELKNYLQETHKKVCQIHRKLPAGGILVFLTGKREILYMCSKLQKSLGVFDRSPNEDDEENDPFANKEEIDEKEKYELLNDDQAEINSDDDVSLEGGFSDDENDDSDDSDFEIEPPKINTEEKVELETKNEEEISMPKSADDVRSRMLAEALGVPANDSSADNETEKTEMETVKPQEEDKEEEEEEPVNLKPLILPLYAMMSPEQQAKVFAAVPEGYRLIVVATNVAETSITIPGVTYVVDSGRCKEKVISSGSSSSGANITKYEVRWITKASSNQRQGRAGRTGPGHCYRLYSANFYHEHMKEYLPPEITQTPLEDVVLQMASIGIKDIESFPFPTMPPVTALNHAINLLSNIGAVLSAPKPVSNILTVSLTEKKPQSEARLLGNLTDIGKMMAKFPVHPRFSKMLVIAVQQIQNSVDKYSLAQTNKKPDFAQIHQSIKLLSYVLTLVATLAERTAFLRNEYDANKANEEDGENNEEDEEDDDESNKPEVNKGLFYHSFGDSMARLVAAGAYFYTLQMLQTKEEAKLRKDQDVDEDDPSVYKPKVSMQTLFKHESLYSFCLSNQLHSMTLQRVYDLRHQLQSIVISLLPSLLQLSSEEESLSSLFTKEALSSSLISPASPPSQSEEIILRQIVLCGYCDNIARKLPLGMIKEGNRRKRLTAYQSCNPAVSEALYIHPNSNLFPSDPTATLPEYIVYSSLLRNHRGDTLYMANLSVINANWIPLIAKDCPLLHWGKPLTSPTPYYDQKLEKMMCYVIPTFGTHSWQLPVVKKAIEEIVLPEIDQQKNALMIGENQTSSQGLVALGYRQCDEVYRWFGRYLLEGQIGLKTKNVLIKTNFNDNIQYITQNKIHPKISSFLRELVKYDIRNKLQLFKLLKSNDKFLSEEIQNLLKIEFRKDFRQVWSKLLDYN